MKVLLVIEQIVLIVFPVIVAALGLLNLTGAIVIAESIQQIVMLALGAVVAIFEVIMSKTGEGVFSSKKE